MGILRGTEMLLRRLIQDRFKPGFTVLEFGDQYVTWQTPHYLARELYARHGCGLYHAVDGNGRGTVTFDLNRKASELARLLKVKGFDLVTDFGTGEHIFDQGQFWRTAHGMIKVGGFFIFDRPSQGYEAHCFWRTDFSTYQDIAAANSYDVIALERHEGRHGGELVRGIFRRTLGGKFRVPQQGRYRKALRPIRCGARQ